MRWQIKDPKARQLRFRQIMIRRQCNAMARSRGFLNYAEMSEYVA